MEYEKKYKDALERARTIRFGNPNSATANVVCEEIFPELAESDDEKIRKEILSIVKSYRENCITEGNHRFDDCIAWLEKQGSEPNWCHHKVDLSNCSEEYRKAYYDGWNNCNMQHSQCKSESNDVVKCLINGMKFYYEDNEEATWGTEKFSMKVKDILSWLERQGEQKPVDKIESKFKVGDWVVYNDANVYQVKEIDYTNIIPRYELENIYGDKLSIPFTSDYNLRNWTIDDAKDGDVLVTKEDNRPFIFKGLLDHNHPNCPVAYCGIDNENEFLVSSGISWWDDCKVEPATKEQRDLLFQKIKEAGYEWDADEKVLVGFDYDNDDEQYEELIEDTEIDLNIKQNPA